MKRLRELQKHEHIIGRVNTHQAQIQLEDEREISYSSWDEQNERAKDKERNGHFPLRSLVCLYSKNVTCNHLEIRLGSMLN